MVRKLSDRIKNVHKLAVRML